MRRQTVAQTCAVQIKGQLIPVTYRPDGFQLRLGVQCAVLGGVRDVYHPRAHHVIPAPVPVESFNPRSQVSRRHLALVLGHRQYLVTARLNGTCLVEGNVPRVRRQNALIGAEETADDGGVGLGAAYQKFHLGVGAVAGGADFVLGLSAVGVLTVADGLFQVGVQKPLEDGRMRAFEIVAVEVEHGRHLSFYFI